MDIRILVGADAPAYQRLRLEGLRDCPTAFATHYEEECSKDVQSVAARLEPNAGRVICGAFEAKTLVGILGIQREERKNLRHKGVIWGMYVTPAARGKGIGRALLKHVLNEAKKMQGLRLVNLWVNAASTSVVAMYRAAGFNQIGVERAFLVVDGASQDLIHMVRFLNGTSGAERV